MSRSPKLPWPSHLGEDVRLPPIPRIKRDTCRYCGSCHTSLKDALDCANANRGEQR